MSPEFLKPKRSGTWLFEPVSFVWYQDKRPGVGGANIFNVIAPETGYTRGYYLFGKKNKDISGENVL